MRTRIQCDVTAIRTNLHDDNEFHCCCCRWTPES